MMALRRGRSHAVGLWASRLRKTRATRPRRKRTPAAARTEIKVPDWRARAVVMRLVVSGVAVVAFLEEVVLVPEGAGKSVVARESAEWPVEDWQRVPSASMPQIPVRRVSMGLVRRERRNGAYRNSRCGLEGGFRWCWCWTEGRRCRCWESPGRSRHTQSGTELPRGLAKDLTGKGGARHTMKDDDRDDQHKGNETKQAESCHDCQNTV